MALNKKQKAERAKAAGQYIENAMIHILAISKGFTDDEESIDVKMLLIQMLAGAFEAGYNDGARHATIEKVAAPFDATLKRLAKR
jgi:hypothetical protein